MAKVIANSEGKVVIANNKALRAHIPATLEPIATTVHKNASQTANYVTNPNCRMLFSDGKLYTMAERNALWVANGYSATGLPEPVALRLDAFEHEGELYYVDRFTGSVYGVTAETNPAAGQLACFIYNQGFPAGAASGTDYTTGKAWASTVDGDNLVLTEANTGQSWTIDKAAATVSNAHLVYNMKERTYAMWAWTEWMRHRMAISSGVTTTKADGTMGEVKILNASGVQAAANEDMYFWVKNDSDTFVNTNLLAKYNLNNRHAVNSANLTSAIADAIYAKQKANGVDMNDTGVNSDTKPVLAPGSKGAEAIAVNGYWMIITPYISNPSATTATITNNIADSPAVYWWIYKEKDGPSDTLNFAIALNYDIMKAWIDYLNQVEGFSLPAIPYGSLWSAVRQSATYCWYANTSNRNLTINNTYNRNYVFCASAS